MNSAAKGVSILFVILFLAYCNSLQPKSEGQVLAEQHCQSCHLAPHPEDIDLATWTEMILPDMFSRLAPASITMEEMTKME